MSVDQKVFEEKGQDIEKWKDFSATNEDRSVWFRGHFIRVHKAERLDHVYKWDVDPAEAFTILAGYTLTVLDGKVLFPED